MFLRCKKRLFLCFLMATVGFGLSAEDGSRLWLRQDTTASATIDCLLHSQTLNIAQRELNRSWKGVPVTLQLCADKEHLALGKDGYTIRTDKNHIVIGSLSETGLLYAAYHLIRLQETDIDNHSSTFQYSALSALQRWLRSSPL